ncbi:ATP-binding protein [Geminicoccus flavidas]|uniref:ATP-binding protein n=1 Tax=Geminicoccus flavidas TaxID=2506407 RepID=UPI00135C5EA5|nr:AAA family ATPase [Geminicoccus flavidas]
MDVRTWLRGLGLGQYEPAFRDNDIDAGLLPTLTADDLRELGVVSLGHRKRLLTAIAALTQPSGLGLPALTLPPTSTASQAERRQLTVMFVDLVGSTALSTRLDPEEMREVLRAYQNSVAGEIARVDGHFARLMGDGVLAYFGWPRAHEDDAERAVRAALAVAEAVPRLATPAGEPLAARIGIASGLVVVGDLIGEGAAQEEAVVGETPNLAARLQTAATPGAVVVDLGTRRLLGEVFELRKLGPTRLKGFIRPVSAYQVLGERLAKSRFEACQPGRPAPMVGRDGELALVLECWRQASTGEGQAVLLVGEAGIGKSRLVRAVLDAVEAEEHAVLRYQCSPYHTATPLWPVAQQLRLTTGAEAGNDDPDTLSKLEALLRQGLEPEEASGAVPLVAALLGIDLIDRSPSPDLTPQQQRARTLAALVGQVLGQARRGPVLLVLEDAHWADPTTLELVGLALDRITSARVLLLVTSRPDGQPALDGHPRSTRLSLSRLGRGPSKAIVTRLAGGRLPPAVLGEIAARTDGVPLFVEELTKAVLEARTGTSVAVPASLHASLMARLDRVPEVKKVAQVAACLGREFAYPLLAAVSPVPELELQAALDRLTTAELVFAQGEPPEASYAFKHALVRDAAHESLLKAERQRLHARIVRVLEGNFPATVDADPELLARHCAEAGLAEQAVDYWQSAGERALARSAMAEAVAQLTRGLEALTRLPDGPDRQRHELGLQLALGQASIAARGFAAPETGRAYNRACDLCRALGDVPALFPALYGRSVHHLVRGELALAHEAARELLHSAEERGDAAARVAGHRMVGAALCQLGRLTESRHHLEAALTLYDPVRDRSSALVYAIDSRVVCLSWLSLVLVVLGYPERALAQHGAALAYARELAHPGTIAVALAPMGCVLHQLLRDRRSAREQAEAAIALASEQAFPHYLAAGTVVRGWAMMDTGRAEEGIAEIRRGLADYGATGGEMWSPYFRSLLAEVQGQRGHATAGLDLVSEAIDQAGRMEAHWIEADLHRLRGELLLALPQPERSEAEACFLRALAIAREQGARLWGLRAATSLARLWRDQGRGDEAREPLARAYGGFTEGFEMPDLREAKALLDELASVASGSVGVQQRALHLGADKV